MSIAGHGTFLHCHSSMSQWSCRLDTGTHHMKASPVGGQSVAVHLQHPVPGLQGGEQTCGTGLACVIPVNHL
jgi:hypothetical protein